MNSTRPDASAPSPSSAKTDGRLLSVPAVAAELGLSPWTVRDLIGSGALRLVWRGNKITHQPAEHDDWATAACGAIVRAADPRRDASPIATVRAPHAQATAGASRYVAAMRAAKSARLAAQIEESRRAATEHQ